MLFVGIAIVAAALYLSLVRPTMMAQAFVAAVAQDFNRAGKLLRRDSDWIQIVRPLNSEKPDRVYAEIMPRQWSDIWNCRRRIRVTVCRHSEKNGGYSDWTEDAELVAGLRGLKVVFPATM
jgi:hypothetical protein